MYAHLIPSKICSLIRLSSLCPLVDYRSSTYTSSTRPFLLCLVNLLILLAYSLHQIQKQNTYLLTVFRPYESKMTSPGRSEDKVLAKGFPTFAARVLPCPSMNSLMQIEG